MCNETTINNSVEENNIPASTASAETAESQAGAVADVVTVETTEVPASETAAADEAANAESVQDSSEAAETASKSSSESAVDTSVPSTEEAEPKEAQPATTEEVGAEFSQTKEAPAEEEPQDIPAVEISENQFISQGKRGLYFRDALGKIYFPDHSFKDACVGCVTDVKITKDKDTYAFFTGTMVTDRKWTLEEAALTAAHSTGRVKWGTVQGTNVLLQSETNENNEKIFVVYADGGRFCTIEDEKRIGALDSVGMKGFSECTQKANILSCLKDVPQDVNPELCNLPNLNLKVARALLISGEKYFWNGSLVFGECETTQCIVFDNKAVFIHKRGSDWTYVQNLFESDGYVVHGTPAEKISDLSLDKKGTLEEIDMKSFWAWIRANRVAFSKSCKKSVNNFAMMEFEGRFSGSSSKLLARNPMRCSLADLVNEDQTEELRKSKETYLAWLKNIGRSVSKASIGELSRVKAGERAAMGYNV